jgi:hypothetical protein
MTERADVAGPGTGGDGRRGVQLLTARALMLALDRGQSIADAAAELARCSGGDLGSLRQTTEQVRALAEEHPGPDATRAVAIVDGAVDRVASLSRHPSTDVVHLLTIVA